MSAPETTETRGRMSAPRSREKHGLRITSRAGRSRAQRDSAAQCGHVRLCGPAQEGASCPCFCRRLSDSLHRRALRGRGEARSGGAGGPPSRLDSDSLKHCYRNSSTSSVAPVCRALAVFLAVLISAAPPDKQVPLRAHFKYPPCSTLPSVHPPCTRRHPLISSSSSALPGPFPPLSERIHPPAPVCRRAGPHPLGPS